MDKASGREGVYRPVSMALIVCRETPRAVPSWPWESPRDDRSSLTLFRTCKAYLSPTGWCQASFTGAGSWGRCRDVRVIEVAVESVITRPEAVRDVISRAEISGFEFDDWCGDLPRLSSGLPPAEVSFAADVCALASSGGQDVRVAGVVVPPAQVGVQARTWTVWFGWLAVARVNCRSGPKSPKVNTRGRPLSLSEHQLCSGSKVAAVPLTEVANGSCREVT